MESTTVTTGGSRGGVAGVATPPPLNFHKIVVIRVAVVIYLVVRPTSSNNPCVFVCVEWCCHWVLHYDRPQIGPALLFFSRDKQFVFAIRAKLGLTPKMDVGPYAYASGRSSDGG